MKPPCCHLLNRCPSSSLFTSNLDLSQKRLLICLLPPTTTVAGEAAASLSSFLQAEDE